MRIIIDEAKSKEKLIDLVSINVAVYINFIHNFNLNLKILYEKIITHIRKGNVLKHFLK